VYCIDRERGRERERKGGGAKPGKACCPFVQQPGLDGMPETVSRARLAVVVSNIGEESEGVIRYQVRGGLDVSKRHDAVCERLGACVVGGLVGLVLRK